MNTLSNKQIYLIGAFSLILGLAFDYLFYDKQVGISFLIYVILLLTGIFGFLIFFKSSYSRTIVWFLPVIIFFSSMAVVRDNEYLLFWNIVITLALLLLLAHQVVGRDILKSLIPDYFKTAFSLPTKMVGETFNALRRMITVSKGVKMNQRTAQITKGILITLPVIILFIFLLASADLVFKDVVANIFSFDFNIDQNIAARIWWVIAFTLIWLGAYTYTFKNASAVSNEAPSPVVRSNIFGNIEIGILFTSLNILFLAFVIIQIRYLFAGHDAVTQLGLSYAEYAHKGFGELIFVALITFGLVFLVEKYIERKGKQSSAVFKWLTGSLIILVLIIMASAFTRLDIYEQAYGFTLLRILVQTFIIWLATVFVWLGYKIFTGKAEHSFIFGIFLLVIVFFAMFNLLNPDAFVARKNIEQLAKTGVLDTNYLATLSADAVPGLINLLKQPELKDKDGYSVSIQAADILKEYRDKTIIRPWQSYNYSRNRALKSIDSHWDLILNLSALNDGEEQE